MPNVSEVLNKAENKVELKAVLSDHFDAVKQPVSVSLGLHLRGQTVEDVVNLLRKDGINAVPYYDEKVQDDLSCFVVDGTGVRSPFMSPEDALRATADIAQIMFKNKVEISRAMPITRASLVPAVSEKYTGNVIDIAKNNPSVPDVKETLSEYLKYAAEKMPAIEIPSQKSNDSIYSGRLFADGYALTPHRRYRDCVYGTNMFSEALTYSQSANKGGLHLEEVDGHSYGFIIETKQQQGQAFYDMAGAERPFATREERQTAKRKENRDDYETLVLEDRNPEIAKYLRIDDKVVQIADENGFFNNDRIDWEKFASLHKPRDTNEPNDYMVARVNKQIEEFPVFAYEKQNDLEEYQPTADIKGYAYKELIRENNDGYEINNASFHSLKLSESLCKTNFTGDVSLVNCTVVENQTLELAHCNGDVSFAHMTYDKNIHLPEQCEYFSLSCVKLPQCDELDLSHTKSQNVTLEDSDLTAAKSLKLPQSDELKLRYDVKMPESLDLSGVKTIIFDQTAKLDLSQTKELKTTGFDVVMRSRDENNPINRLVDTYAMKILSGLPEWNHSAASSDADVARQKLNFAAKMTELKASLNEYNIQDEKSALRAMDLVIAQHVPDEHIEIVIDGEKHRAADEYISKSPELQYKIPPQENNNLVNSNEKFDKSELFTLIAPSKPDEIANILVAEKQINNRTVGIVAVDSFMIEYGNEKEYEKVNKIADYVLEQSTHWDDVIFDVRGNGGGDATIIKQIGERMADKKLEYADKIEVINPELAVHGGPPDRYEQKAGDKTFTGNVYVLQDRGDSSAGDGAIWMLRQMDNCTTIGENTHGAFAGGDVKKHQMEGGTLLLGNTYRKRIMPDGTKVEEGKGITPDVASESKDAYSQAMSLITQKSQELESQKQIDFRINPIYSCYSLWQDTLNGNNDPVFEQRTKEFVNSFNSENIANLAHCMIPWKHPQTRDNIQKVHGLIGKEDVQTINELQKILDENFHPEDAKLLGTAISKALPDFQKFLDNNKSEIAQDIKTLNQSQQTYKNDLSELYTCLEVNSNKKCTVYVNPYPTTPLYDGISNEQNVVMNYSLSQNEVKENYVADSNLLKRKISTPFHEATHYLFNNSTLKERLNGSTTGEMKKFMNYLTTHFEQNPQERKIHKGAHENAVAAVNESLAVCSTALYNEKMYGQPVKDGDKWYHGFEMANRLAPIMYPYYKQYIQSGKKFDDGFFKYIREGLENNERERLTFQSQEKPSKAPEMKFNPTSMEFEYANPTSQELAERRQESDVRKQKFAAMKAHILNPESEKNTEIAKEKFNPFIKNYLEQRRSK